jgi:magnesium transporter
MTRAILEHDDVTVDGEGALDITSLIEAGSPFWLDVEDPTDETIDLIASALDLHELAVEDSKRFGQRAKLVRYGDVAMVVGFGLDTESGHTIEVHGYFSDHAVVTLRRQPSVAIAALHRSGSVRALLGSQPLVVLHHLASKLHEQFPAYIDQLERRLSEVEASMVDDPRPEHLAEVTTIRQHADELRRALAPGRDLAARTLSTSVLPGLADDAELYAHDIADELRLIVGDLVAVSEQCVAALGLHASLASNRQAATSRQLAGVATVFLPISFVVGFFGMNFDVLVNDFEQGWVVFVLFGVVLNVACVIGTIWWLGRRGWR